MTSTRCFRFLSFAIPVLLLGACTNLEFTRVKPGQSVSAAIAARDNPPPSESIVTTPGGIPDPADGLVAELEPTPLPPPPVGIVPEPALPDPANTADRVADLYTRGCFAMREGKNDEATTALEEAVKLDPDFADAWTKLVLLYQNSGKPEKAVEAYKKAKQLGGSNGAGPGPKISGGLGLQP